MCVCVWRVEQTRLPSCLRVNNRGDEEGGLAALLYREEGWAPLWLLGWHAVLDRQTGFTLGSGAKWQNDWHRTLHASSKLARVKRAFIGCLLKFIMKAAACASEECRATVQGQQLLYLCKYSVITCKLEKIQDLFSVLLEKPTFCLSFKTFNEKDNHILF